MTHNRKPRITCLHWSDRTYRFCIFPRSSALLTRHFENSFKGHQPNAGHLPSSPPLQHSILRVTNRRRIMRARSRVIGGMTKLVCYCVGAGVLLAVAFSTSSLEMISLFFPSVEIPSFLAVEIRVSSGAGAVGAVGFSSPGKVVNSFCAFSNSLRACPIDLASSGILFGPQRKTTASTPTTIIISQPVTANSVPLVLGRFHIS